MKRSRAGRGVVLALKRLGRCRPYTQGGYDPVPEVLETRVERRDIAAQRPVR
jgi:putative component of membrane protein insertase Oxa1/YidC/SpoIIIJ protein YidD